MHEGELEPYLEAKSGAIDECVLWVNHTLFIDQKPPAAWSGKIPLSATSITIEVGGVGTSGYHVTITVDGQVVTDVDRALQGGSDVFKKSIYRELQLSRHAKT